MPRLVGSSADGSADRATDHIAAGAAEDAASIVSAAEHDVYTILDRSLVRVIEMAGWPIWYTSGGGRDVPSKAQCDFAQNKLKWCARIDSCRGIVADDLQNTEWAELLEHLPGYRFVLSKQQDPSSVVSMGNAMEMAVGLSYACHTNFEHLPQGHRLEFRNEIQERAIMLWSIMWPLFQKLGLTATERISSPVVGRSATEHPVGHESASSSSFGPSGGAEEHAQQPPASLEPEAAAGTKKGPSLELGE